MQFIRVFLAVPHYKLYNMFIKCVTAEYAFADLEGPT